MRITITILFLLLHAITYGQKIRFTDTSNRWTHINSHSEGSVTGTDYYKGEVVINGIHYKKLAASRILNLYIREDTIARKVYCRIDPTDPAYADTSEHIFHDYTLGLGDTFTSTIITYQQYDTFKNVVIAIDTAIINGTPHLIWALRSVYQTHGPAAYKQYTLIEGIGCMLGMDYTLMPYSGLAWEHLICFENNGSIITVPMPTGGYYLSPQTCALSVASNVGNNKTITISPNPANQYSKITFPNTVVSGSLIITDILGRRLASKSIINQTAIPIGELPALGVYFYTITDNNSNKSFTGKFIYE
ncbi:MAG: T9SS type A sorting domain-containing protein [Flavipsychrobacter sp.]|nr:T9SS type A sorting domain-containing protein [Flavipsychrobacter sp.]